MARQRRRIKGPARCKDEQLPPCPLPRFDTSFSKAGSWVRRFGSSRFRFSPSAAN